MAKKANIRRISQDPVMDYAKADKKRISGATVGFTPDARGEPPRGELIDRMSNDFTQKARNVDIVLYGIRGVDTPPQAQIGVPYFYYNTTIQIPVGLQETNTVFHQNPSTVSITPKYNFKSMDYENSLIDVDDPREILSVYFNKVSKDNKYYSRGYTVSPDTLSTNMSDLIFRSYPMALKEDGFRQFYKFENFRLNQSQDAIDRMRHFIFGRNFNFGYFSANKHEFPMYIDLKIKDSSNRMPNGWLSKLGDSDTSGLDYYEKYIMRSQSTEFNDSISGTDSDNINFDYRMKDFRRSVRDSYLASNTLKSVILSEEYWNHHNYPSFLQLGLDRMFFERAFYNQTRTNWKTEYRDLFFENKHQAEFLYFKIDKYLGPTSAGQPVQSYYVFGNHDPNNIIDTQIKMGEDYYYVINGYCLIYGTYYTYNSASPTMFHQDGGNEMQLSQYWTQQLNLTMNPSLKILEVPIFESAVSVMEPRPMVPNVNFSTRSDSTNKIKVHLQLQTGRTRARFFPILRGESVLDNIEFQHVEGAGTFQIFRTDVPPTTLEDFRNQTFFQQGSDIGDQSINFVDYIFPNKKYYYMFRAVSDETNLPGNPTGVYEVELLKDADDSKVNVSIYNVEQNRPVQTQKSINFRRLLQVNPVTTNLEIGGEATELFTDGLNTIDTFENKLNEINLGGDQNNLFGRKFKLRVKSNDTGKMIDFNLNFNVIKKT